jgi:hypothetical protein
MAQTGEPLLPRHLRASTLLGKSGVTCWRDGTFLQQQTGTSAEGGRPKNGAKVRAKCRPDSRERPAQFPVAQLVERRSLKAKGQNAGTQRGP